MIEKSEYLRALCYTSEYLRKAHFTDAPICPCHKDCSSCPLNLSNANDDFNTSCFTIIVSGIADRLEKEYEILTNRGIEK